MTDQLPAAAAAVDCAADVVASATDHLARESTVDGRISVARLDEHQVLGYDLAIVEFEAIQQAAPTQ